MGYKAFGIILAAVISINIISESTYKPDNTIYNIYKPKIKVITIDTLKDLLQIVDSSKHIRILGSGWSWNNSCFSDDTTLRLGRDFKNKAIDINNNTIRLGAGVLLINAFKYLEKSGKQLKSTGHCMNIDRSQTIGGLCSNNVHHTGTGILPFSDSCLKISVLNYHNNKIKSSIKKYKHNDKNFNYFFGTVGTMGIITEAVFEIEDIQCYKLITKSLKFDEFKDNPDYLITKDIIAGGGWYINIPFSDVGLYQTYAIENKDSVTQNRSINIFNEYSIIRLLQIVTPSIIAGHSLKHIIPFYIKNYNDTTIKSLYNVGASANHYHIENEIYIKLIDFNKFNKIQSIEKWSNKFIITYRYIPKIQKSIFTLNDDLIAITFVNFQTNKNLNIKLQISLFKILKSKNIDFYPHFGKFINENTYFSDFFDTTKYETKRKLVDPNNKFISKFNYQSTFVA